MAVSPKDKAIDILFGVPTLYDPLPPGDQDDPGPADAFRLHEDAWRQVEFVGSSQVDDVERDLSELRAFMRGHRKGARWTGVHVRRQRPDGLLAMKIEQSRLESLLGGTAATRPLTIDGVGLAPFRVTGGFAIDITPDLVLYGTVAGGCVASLGVASPDGSLPVALESPVLARMSGILGLRLVDWPSARWVLSDNGRAAGIQRGRDGSDAPLDRIGPASSAGEGMANRMVNGIVAGILMGTAAAVIVPVAITVIVAIRVWSTMPAASGRIGAVSVGVSGAIIALAAAGGFAIGFWWRFSRGAAQRPR